MIDKENEGEFVESPSRRSFLGASSVALAATAFVGLTASAQQREDTQKAESDHSSSDPGQENMPLLAENPNSNTPPPTDHGDIGPIWYSFDLARKRVEEGGWTHQVTQRELPPSTDLAGVNMRITRGSFRELHWHTADEWAIMLTGNARVTCLNPDEADINKGMVQQAKRKIAVTDHSKLGTITKWLICPTELIDLLITDRGATDEMIAPFLGRGIKVSRV